MAAPPSDSPLPFEFNEYVVTQNPEPTRALVMTPAHEMVFGRERISQASQSSTLSPVERRMVERIEQRTPETSLLILDASPGGENLWRFDPSFTTEELEAVGAAFVSALLPFYRRVAAAGIVSFAHVGWNPSDLIPVRTGVRSLVDGASQSDQDPDLAALDQWIAKNLVLYSSLSREHFTKTLLPEHIPLLARRHDRVRELVERVPPAAIA